MEITIGRTVVRSHRGDLTTLEVDAIVNPANEHLVHAGGLAAAIVRAGGDVIQQESDARVLAEGPLHPGVAAVTGAGRLPCRGVIHVAGPVYVPGRDNEGLLRTAVDAALTAAAGRGYRTVALPAISAGVFGYPLEEAAAVAASQAARWAGAHPDALHLILLVGFDERAEAAFAGGLAAVGEPAEG